MHNVGGRLVYQSLEDMTSAEAEKPPPASAPFRPSAASSKLRERATKSFSKFDRELVAGKSDDFHGHVGAKSFCEVATG